MEELIQIAGFILLILFSILGGDKVRSKARKAAPPGPRPAPRPPADRGAPAPAMAPPPATAGPAPGSAREQILRSLRDEFMGGMEIVEEPPALPTPPPPPRPEVVERQNISQLRHMATSATRAVDRKARKEFLRQEAVEEVSRAAILVGSGKERLREAIIWREILGPPRAFRQYGETGVDS